MSAMLLGYYGSAMPTWLVILSFPLFIWRVVTLRRKRLVVARHNERKANEDPGDGGA